MAIINWPQNPLVQLENHHPYDHKIKWLGDQNLPAQIGDAIEFSIRMVSLGNQERTWFKYMIETVDLSNNVIDTISTQQVSTNDRTDTFRIPLNSQILRFRITVANLNYIVIGTLEKVWYPSETRYFSVFVNYFGDFSLDYIPMTILYDPPFKNWTNQLIQSQDYVTRVSVGGKKDTGSSSESSLNISGGINIGISGKGPSKASASMGGSSSRTSSQSQSVGNGHSNMVTMGYSHQTTLSVDNQRTVGKENWGALSDIFVLLENPWFRINGDENGDLNISVSPFTETKTKIVIVPAYLLLRPGEDPIASRIPADTRYRLLQMDPFITNLDPFFPNDTGAPLMEAVDQYKDPSEGNRAALVAEYAISRGVILDLSSTTDINVLNTLTNEKNYNAKVSKTYGMTSTFEASYMFIGVDLGVSTSDSTSNFVSVSYFDSLETSLGLIKTAKCFLIRDQEEEVLDDFQIWWDKNFSTYMFRKVKTGFLTGVIAGTLFDTFEIAMPNAEISLEVGREIYKTSTDHVGRFRFDGIPQGKAILKYGGGSKNISITDKDIKAGIKDLGKIKSAKRIIDLRNSSYWELAEVFGLDIPTVRNLFSEWRKTSKPTEKAFFSLLKKYKVNEKKVLEKVVINRY